MTYSVIYQLAGNNGTVTEHAEPETASANRALSAMQGYADAGVTTWIETSNGQVIKPHI